MRGASDCDTKVFMPLCAKSAVQVCEWLLEGRDHDKFRFALNFCLAARQHRFVLARESPQLNPYSELGCAILSLLQLNWPIHA